MHQTTWTLVGQATAARGAGTRAEVLAAVARASRPITASCEVRLIVARPGVGLDVYTMIHSTHMYVVHVRSVQFSSVIFTVA